MREISIILLLGGILAGCTGEEYSHRNQTSTCSESEEVIITIEDSDDVVISTNMATEFTRDLLGERRSGEIIAVEEIIVDYREVEDQVEEREHRSGDVNPYDDYQEQPELVEEEELYPCEDFPEQYKPGGAANPYGVYPMPCKAYKVTREEC